MTTLRIPLNSEIGNKSGFFNLNIKFLNDMNTVKNVYIINSLMKEEVEKLEIEK